MALKRGVKYLLFIVLGVFIGFTIVGGVVFYGVSVVSALMSTGMTSVQNNSILVVDYAGTIKEKPVEQSFFGYGKEIEFLRYVRAIEAAAGDSRIKGILINGDLTFYDRVHTEELIDALNNFKDSGKKVYAWFSRGIASNYILCTAADAIYMPDTDAAGLSLGGYAMTMPYFKAGLDKLGVEFNVVHIGDYKGAGENYVRNSMSPQLRSSYERFLDNLYDTKIETITASRDLSADTLHNLLRSVQATSLTPKMALEAGLIDGFANYPEMINKFGVVEEMNTVSVFDYAMSFNKSRMGDKVAVIYAEGSITNYFTSEDGFFGDFIGAKSMIYDIERIKDDDSIKAVILRINSPGGSALASELMLQELNKLNEVKPVYVSQGPIAASGGYYLSCAGKKVYTSPSTLTGSIGVVSMFFNHVELMDKLGVSYETIKKYPYDDFLSPSRKATDAEVEVLRKSMEDIYTEFTGHVVESRNLEPDVVEQLAGGRIWTGKEAVENGLADEIATLSQVINKVVNENNIGSYSIVSFPEPPNFFDEMRRGRSGVRQEMASFFRNSGLKHIMELYNLYQIEGEGPYYLFTGEIEE